MKNLKHVLRNFAAVIVTGLASLTLGGCTVLQPVKPATINTYALEAQFEPVATGAGEKTIVVNTPSALSGFNSPRMVYTKRLYEIGYFSENQWVDSPARMLAPLLVKALEHSAKYQAVLDARSSANADLRLDTEIIRLQHEFMTRPSQVHLTVRAQLLDIGRRRVLASREFDVVEAVPGDDPYEGVIAANRAVKILLQQIADFCALGSQTGESHNARD